MRALIGILASLLILWAAAPLGAQVTEPPIVGPPVLVLPPVEQTLTTAPLGRVFVTNETLHWVASLVNAGKHSVTATIEFCDEAGACVLGGATFDCTAALLGPGKGCFATLSSGDGLWYARMRVSGIPPINVRGVLQFLGDLADPPFGDTVGAVEAQ